VRLLVTPAALLGGGLVIAAILIGSLEPSTGGRSRRDVLVGVTIGVTGSVFVAAGVALIDGLLSPDQVLGMTAFRLLAATVALVPLVLLRPDRAILGRLFRPSPWWRSAVPGAICGAALAMWAWLYAFALTDVAIAAILNQLSTIWIFILAWLVLKEPVTWRRAVAVTLAFAGAALVVVAA
jgi:drug/metabolite transporter (DMT)-like permease